MVLNGYVYVFEVFGFRFSMYCACLQSFSRTTTSIYDLYYIFHSYVFITC